MYNNDLVTVNSNLSGKIDGARIEANISVNTGVEVGNYIRDNVPLTRLLKGFSFNLIPMQTPGWWSGQMFCDAATWTEGATCWGYFMNRDTNIWYKYRSAYGGADSVTPFSSKEIVTLFREKIGVPTDVELEKTFQTNIANDAIYVLDVSLNNRMYNYAFGWTHNPAIYTDGTILDSQCDQIFDEVYTINGYWTIKGGTYIKIVTGEINTPNNNWDAYIILRKY